MADQSKPASSSIRPGARKVRTWSFPSIREFWIFDRRWFADTFSREKLLESLRTLLWVAPLTILIWIYAEREQVARLSAESIPFELVSTKKERLVTLKPPQDSNVVIACEGPRARVEEVLRQIRVGRDGIPGLELAVDPANTGSEIQINLAALVANHPLFTQNGISVTRCQPERANVLVDTIVERTARVSIPPGIATLDPTTTFEPASVLIRAPDSKIAAALQQSVDAGQLVVYARLQDRPELKQPGEHSLKGIPIELPEALRNGETVEVTPKTIDVTLQVRQPDTEITIPSMPVLSTTPNGFLDNYSLEFEGSITNVTLIGPAAALQNLENNPKRPYADFTVTSADVGEGKVKALDFRNLPPGVRVSDRDLERTITVDVIPRTGSLAP